MKILIETLKRIYHLILPSGVRGRIRYFIFKQLRITGIINFLRKLGILTCNNQLQINVSNVEETFKSSNDCIRIYKMVEEDAIKPAIHIEGQELDGMQPFIARTETVVIDIAECGFSLRNNYLLDKDLNVVTECGIEFEKLAIYFHVLPKVNRVKGTVAYLSDPDLLNYYHWMCRTLPLLRIYQKCFERQEIDFFYVGQDPLANFHRETLAKAGVAMNQVIQEPCTADKIIAAFNSRTVNYGDPISKEAYLFSKHLFYNVFDVNKRKHRIYVKRGNVKRRKVINESQIIVLLEKYGFEPVVMDNKTVQEQAEIFAQAEAIVAPHGAALTNLLFIQPGVKVIELIPYGYLNNCFYALASYGEAEYFYLEGEKIIQGNLEGRKLNRYVDVRYLNLYIDIQKLDQICQMASLSHFSVV
jgi:hypothetical protein